MLRHAVVTLLAGKQAWSGGCESVFELDFDLVLGSARLPGAMRTAGAAALGTGAQSFIEDRLDGPGAAAAFRVAPQAAINLLGVARKVRGCIHCIADIMVAEDVAGTDDHEVGGPFGRCLPIIGIEGGSATQRGNQAFVAIPNCCE